MKTESVRIDRDQLNIEIARLVARRSTCIRAAVGAVITKENHIIGTGYNGSPRGLPHCIEVGCTEVDGHCKRSIHAELNAILSLAYFGVEGRNSTLYCTHKPCGDCTRALLNAGIVRIIYAQNYGGPDFENLMNEAGFKVQETRSSCFFEWIQS